MKTRTLQTQAPAQPNLALRRERERRHWTQSELALQIGSTYLTICRWEGGVTRPGLYYRKRLCEAFGLPPEALGLAPVPDSTPGEERVPADRGDQPLPPVAVWQVPFRRNPFFTGREALLARLEALLGAGRTAALSQAQALSGLGGIGKTQTAVEYAYRHRQDYQAVFWARAETREALQTDVMSMAELLSLPERLEQKYSQMLTAIRRWLSSHDRWLLILDNVEELALVEELLPAVVHGHLLLTTRAQSTAGIAQRLDVEEMEPAEGALLLLRRAELLAPDAPLEVSLHAPTALTIAQLLDGLPLALDQAGAYIEETGCSPGDYLERYRRYQSPLLQRRGRRPLGHPVSVGGTFALAFENVQRANPAAADLLRLCAFLAPDAIPEELIASAAAEPDSPLRPLAADPLALDEAYATLRRYSLIRRNPGDKTLTIHRLVQAVLKESMEEQTQRRWVERAVCAVSRAFPQGAYINWAGCERLLPHAQVAITFLDRYDLASPEAARLLYLAGFYLRDRALYEQAEPLLQRAVAMREQVLGVHHPETVQALAELAWLYYYREEYAQAEALHLRVLALQDQVCGPEPWDVADSLRALGDVYRKWGKYAAAEPLLLRALALDEQQLGPAHPDLANTISDLAVLYVLQGRHAEAEALHLRALAIREQALGAEHPAVALSLHNLASTYRAQGRYDVAEPSVVRALAIREQVLGAHHPDVAQSLSNLAAIYREQGRYDEAEPLLLRALAINEQALGTHNVGTADVMANLGQLYREQGRLDEAEALLRQTLAIRVEILGPDNRWVAASLDHLAQLCEIRHRDDEARSLYRQALSIAEQALGPHHRDTAAIRERYARTQEKLNPSGTTAGIVGDAEDTQSHR